MRATTVEEILRHCDRYRVTEASGGVPEYFFDRNYTRNGVLDAVVWVISHLVPKERGREIIDYDWDKRTALALPESSSLILPILRHVILLGAATLSHL